MVPKEREFQVLELLSSGTIWDVLEKGEIRGIKRASAEVQTLAVLN